MQTNHVEAGQGRSVWVVGDRYTIKTSGAETGGALAVIEGVVPPDHGPPPHIHHREDEAFYVIDGDVEFHADGQSFRAGPGDWITLAKGSLHTFRNVSDRPARLLILVTPAGLEDFFLEIGRPALDGEDASEPTAEDIARLLAVAPKYGLEIRPPNPR